MAGLSTFRLLTVAATLMGVGTVGFYNIDGMLADDAKGHRWVNAFYCCVITLTTVGYGDICPSDKLSHLGQIFIISLAFCGLGMFCGPIMDFSCSWKKKIPGGVIGPGLCALGVGILLFTQIEHMSVANAAYFTVMTGTTVGYGDIGPATDVGRLATALLVILVSPSAILVVNVIGGMLEPAKSYLSRLCMSRPESSSTKAKKTKTIKKKKV